MYGYIVGYVIGKLFRFLCALKIKIKLYNKKILTTAFVVISDVHQTVFGQKGYK
jgi:hypothetical protein